MDPLRDIRGIDSISWWPLAPGWWLLLMGITILMLLIWWFIRRRKLYPLGRWQQDARHHLITLRRRIKREPVKLVASELSELLRRIAIARCGRSMTASLTDEAWLDWLQRNDSSGFPWREKGRLLLELPYAPPDRSADKAELGQLIDAAIHWVSEETCHV
jgi:LPXTG-motif cell wall-anchored protein